MNKLKVNDMTTYQYAATTLGNSWQRHTRYTSSKLVMIKYVSPKLVIGFMGGRDVEFRPRKNGKWMQKGDWAGDARKFDDLGLQLNPLDKKEVLETAKFKITGLHPDKLNADDRGHDVSSHHEVSIYQQWCNLYNIEWNDFLNDAFNLRIAEWRDHMTRQVNSHNSRLTNAKDKVALYKRNIIHLDNTGEYENVFGAFENAADARQYILDMIDEATSEVNHQQQERDSYQNLLDKGYPRVIDHARTWHDKVAKV